MTGETTTSTGPSQEAIQRIASLFYSGRNDDALVLAQDMVRDFPQHAIGWLALGTILGQMDRRAEAIAPLQRAVELNPSDSETHCNLGIILKSMARIAEAEHHCRRALALRPGYIEAQWNLSLSLLRQGKYDEAWREYEVRHHPNMAIKESPPPPSTAAHPLPPRWQGESLAGKSLLVWPEQGLGDEIQFARFLPQLKTLGARRIVLGCKPPLKALLEAQGLADHVFDVASWQPAMAREFDTWSYLLSLPLHLGITLDNLPAKLPYLSAAAQGVAQWQPRLPQPFRVGLVWKGNPGHANDAYRSLPSLAALAPLWDVPGISFISLQKGAAVSEFSSVQPITHLGDELRDFADTAAIVSQLDLVICVDTAIAHLAGALKTPCWVMLPFRDTDWRWMDGREDSPWYPDALRLLRQIVDGDWSDVIARSSEVLRTIVSAPRAENSA